MTKEYDRQARMETMITATTNQNSLLLLPPLHKRQESCEGDRIAHYPDQKSKSDTDATEKRIDFEGIKRAGEAKCSSHISDSRRKLFFESNHDALITVFCAVFRISGNQ
jgi:hypothetical protein